MSSSIDSKGIIRILFGNNSITPLQSISELYHNSYDSGATRVNMYCKTIPATEEDIEEKWFVFEDNGTGMSMEIMEQYLTLLNVEKDKNKKDNEGQHGKYGFGGKQAIFQLSGITNTDKSDRAYVLSKQKGCVAVCCEFDISKLLEKGWTSSIEACLLSDTGNSGTGFRTCVKRRAPELNNNEFHGTVILIKMNNQLESLFADIENIKYHTSINFYKCLDTCGFWCGISPNSLTKVEMYDPLHYDEVDPKYKKEVTVKCYEDTNNNRYFVINRGDVDITSTTNKKQNVYMSDGKDFVKFEVKNTTEIGQFKMYTSMLYYYYGIDKYIEGDKVPDIYERENCIYLCRNDSIIGTYEKIKHKVVRTSRIENTSQWMRVRISIESTSDLTHTMDNIFGINMNKGSIMYNSLPEILQKTLLRYNVRICTEFRNKLLAEPVAKPVKPVARPVAEPVKPVARPVAEPVKPVARPLTVTEHITAKEKEIQSTVVKRPVKPLIKESDIRDKLATEEKGKCEVNMCGKRIDVLTDEYVIEIKRYDDRLDALKVLYYHLQYPDHKPRIHLFNQDGTRCPREQMFEDVCKKHNIKLTYEF
jgi:hypothetical protein